MFRYPFLQCSCPVCGRPLEVREDYLGQKVTCMHCHGQFVACKETTRHTGTMQVASSLIEQADRLLAISARSLFRYHTPAAQSH